MTPESVVKQYIGDLVFQLAVLQSSNEALQATVAEQAKRIAELEKNAASPDPAE